MDDVSILVDSNYFANLDILEEEDELMLPGADLAKMVNTKKATDNVNNVKEQCGEDEQQ
ncbi:unnamed protein product [Dovyalis caffra]|uniref:Uncharacterized protein n=1 Tax=Dovyalis caffra TaxID=77055 RepID=A0AAV1RJE1_9ROSI|nr:unnamed protein product [Dovyalis caffra]